MVAVSAVALAVWSSIGPAAAVAPLLTFLAGALGYVAQKRVVPHADPLRAAVERLVDDNEACEIEDDALRALVAACEDAIEQSRLRREQAERVVREKDEFLLALRHDLRTPLNTVLGFSEVLKSGLDGPLQPAQLESVSIIESSGAHLLSLFDDVLAISVREPELRPEALDVSELLLMLAAELRGQVRRDVLVEVRIEMDLPKAWADPKRVRQVVTNLASNAAKFTERGCIALGARKEAEGVVIVVVDTGCGIAPEELETIFDEFGQGGLPASRKGAGLGLAIARRLTERMSGRIAATSELGQGSTFTLTLPRAP